MKTEDNSTFTVIPAPAGVRGIFEIAGEDGPELEIDDVAFLRVDHDAVRDEGIESSPTGYSLFGARAHALIQRNGIVIATVEESMFRNIQTFMKGCKRISMDGDKYKPLTDVATGKPIEWQADTTPA